MKGATREAGLAGDASLAESPVATNSVAVNSAAGSRERVLPSISLLYPGHPSTQCASPLVVRGRLESDVRIDPSADRKLSFIIREVADPSGSPSARGVNSQLVNEQPSLTSAYLRDFRWVASEQPYDATVEDSAEFEASLDMTSYLRRSAENRTACEIELVCRWARKSWELESNPIRLAILAPELFVAPIGGFDFPPGGLFVGDVLPISGWALSPQGRLLRVRILANGHEVGRVSAPLASPQVVMAFPDAPGADRAQFTAVIRRAEVVKHFKARFSQRLQLTAVCEFADGSQARFVSAAFVWQAYSKLSPGLELLQTRMTAHGTIEIEGRFGVQVGEGGPNCPVQLVVTGRNQTIAISAAISAATSKQITSEHTLGLPGQSGNVTWSRAVDLENYQCIDAEPSLRHFRVECDPGLFGRFPGWVEIYGLVGRAPRRVELGNNEELMRFNRLLRQSVQAQSSLINRLRAMHTFVTRVLTKLRSDKNPQARIPVDSKANDAIAVAFHNLSLCEGAPRVMLEVVRALRQVNPGQELIVFSTQGGEGEALLHELNIPVHLFPELSAERLNWESFHRQRREIAALLKIYEVGQVFANTLDCFWLIDAARSLELPRRWLIHESIDPGCWAPSLDARLRARFFHDLQNCDQVVFVSEATKRLFSPYTGGTPSSVIPNGIAVEEFRAGRRISDRERARELLSLSEQKFVVAIIGTTTERKGQDVFLRAIAKLAKDHPEVPIHGLVVGAREGDYLDRLRNFVALNELSTVVEFVPETSDISCYTAAANAIVIASRNESSPLVALEAFALERPLISTTIFGLDELTGDGRALTFPVDDANALAERLVELYAEPRLVQELTERGLRFVREERDLALTSGRYLKLLGAVAS